MIPDQLHCLVFNFCQHLKCENTHFIWMCQFSALCRTGLIFGVSLFIWLGQLVIDGAHEHLINSVTFAWEYFEPVKTICKQMKQRMRSIEFPLVIYLNIRQCIIVKMYMKMNILLWRSDRDWLYYFIITLSRFPPPRICHRNPKLEISCAQCVCGCLYVMRGCVFGGSTNRIKFSSLIDKTIGLCRVCSS